MNVFAVTDEESHSVLLRVLQYAAGLSLSPRAGGAAAGVPVSARCSGSGGSVTRGRGPDCRLIQLQIVRHAPGDSVSVVTLSLCHCRTLV